MSIFAVSFYSYKFGLKQQNIPFYDLMLCFFALGSS